MVIGLLVLAAIPSVTAVSLGISERSKPETAARERARLRKFTLTAWCAGRSRGKADVHGGEVVLGEGKMWIQPRRGNRKGRGGSGEGREGASASASAAGGGEGEGGERARGQAQQHPADKDAVVPMHAFDGFYLDYPDEQRPPPAPTGLVSMVSQSPPTMNWIYVDADTGEVRHGNRTQSRRHTVGDFGWTGEDEEGGLEDDADPGGLTLDGDELFVAVQPADDAGGRWQVFWDADDDALAGRARAQRGLQGRLVLRISLERSFVEEAGSLQD